MGCAHYAWLFTIANMKISKLLHAALLVNDLQRAKQFYEGVLGLKEKLRHDFDFEGVWYDLGENELHLMVASHPLSRHHTY